MKKSIAGLVGLAVLAVATAAGSSEPARLQNLTDCQLAYLAACYQATGNYEMCYHNAEMYTCS